MEFYEYIYNLQIKQFFKYNIIHTVNTDITARFHVFGQIIQIDPDRLYISPLSLFIEWFVLRRWTFCCLSAHRHR